MDLYQASLKGSLQIQIPDDYLNALIDERMIIIPKERDQRNIGILKKNTSTASSFQRRNQRQQPSTLETTLS